MTTTGLRFTDLDDHARQTALAHLTPTCGPWPYDDTDGHLADTVAAALAAAVGARHLPQVEVTTWRPGTRPAVHGVLDRGNAPALPWPPHIRRVHLDGTGHVRVDTGRGRTTGAGAMHTAVEQALATAVQTAYHTVARRHALELVAATDPLFTPTGHPLPSPA